MKHIPRVKSFTLSSGDGTKTVYVKYKDAAGNESSAVYDSIALDTTPPTVMVTSTETSPTNAALIPFTVTLSDYSSSFGVEVTNGTPDHMNKPDSKTWVFYVEPDADGTVTFKVLATSVYDAAGNGNPDDVQLSIVSDRTAPTVSITTAEPDPTNAVPIPVTITFSEDVTAFEVGDITVGNGSADNFSGSGTTYTADITPDADGTVTVDIAADAAVDVAGNGNTAAAQFSIVSDTIAPTVSITTTEPDPTNTVPIPVTITFSEAVTGFDVSDITVSNGSAGNFSGSGTTYTADITPDADGTITVDIAADAAIDVAGNGNTAAAQLSIVSDTLAPTGTSISINGGDTYTNSTSVTLTLSATGASDMMISENSDFSGASYEAYSASKAFTLSSTDGTKTVYVKYKDAAGNESTVVSDTIELDTVHPTVTITSSESDPTKRSAHTNHDHIQRSCHRF